MPLAILDSAGRLVTLVRDDVPEGWQPPEDCTVIPESELPAGCPRAPAGAIPALSRRQLRRWLIIAGIPLEAVQAQIDAIADPGTRELARVDWECADTYQRDYPLVDAIGGALGLTAEQIDEAFIEASGS